MTKKIGRAVAGLVAASLISGCSTFGKDTTPVSAVADSWGEQMAKYLIYPVFPPRADIQVGDVFLTCVGNGDEASLQGAEGPTKRSLWLTSLYGIVDNDRMPKSRSSKDDPPKDKPATDQPGLLTRQYQTRFQIPEIPPAVEASSPVEASAPDVAAGQGDKAAPVERKKVKVAERARAAPPLKAADTPSGLFKPTRPTKLRIVSFPEFFSVYLTKAQAKALIPFPTVIAQAGVNFDDASSIQMSVPQAESYGVPLVSIMDAWDEQLKSNRMISAMRAVGTLVPRFCEKGVPGFLVVSEVYAARAIDVSITYSRSAGGNAAVGIAYDAGSSQASILDAFKKYLNVGDSGGQTDGAKPVNKGQAADGMNPAPTPASQPTISQATAFIQQLNDLSKQVANDAPLSYPGVQISVFHGRGAGVVMSRKFDSPVVIGFRAVSIPVSTKERPGYGCATAQRPNPTGTYSDFKCWSLPGEFFDTPADTGTESGD